MSYFRGNFHTLIVDKNVINRILFLLKLFATSVNSIFNHEKIACELELAHCFPINLIYPKLKVTFLLSIS